MGDVMGEESQLLVDGCTALLHLLFGENNWKRWSEMRQRTGHTSFHPLFSWLLDLAEHELNEKMQTDGPPRTTSKPNDLAVSTSSSTRSTTLPDDAEPTPPSLPEEGIDVCKAPKEEPLDDEEEEEEIVVDNHLERPSGSPTAPEDNLMVAITAALEGPNFNFHCKTCKMGVANVDLVREHLIWSHFQQVLSLTCKCCDQKFFHLDDFIDTHSSFPSTSQDTPKVKRKKEMDRYKKRPSYTDYIRNRLTQNESFSCNICGKDVVNSSCSFTGVKKEILDANRPLFLCSDCQGRFNNVDTLRSHQKQDNIGVGFQENHLRIPPTSQSKNTPLIQCPFCSLGFATERTVNKHVTDFHEEIWRSPTMFAAWQSNRASNSSVDPSQH